MSKSKSPNKTITITFPNGESWQMDAEEIAHQRASYYAEHDAETEDITDPKYKEVYREEFELTLSYAGVIKDWIERDCNWSDLLDVGIKKINDPDEIDYQQMLCDEDTLIEVE